ncbi:MAG: DUF4129 domain-containing protein [Candidatus Poseidonia sp.]|nr:DUF4129 domain-containing protein [Poseidonia sp.]
MLSKTELQTIEERQQFTMASVIVFLMLTTSMMALVMAFSQADAPPRATTFVDGGEIDMTAAQSTDQGGQGGWMGAQHGAHTESHEALSNMMWSDPGVASGIILDLSVLESAIPSYSSMLEETSQGDHDNDGIDDLNDLDDDNDGIYDLLERFDGCYGTDPYDHDNDGIPDIDDWDDDNDGILEGPLDYDALEAQGLDPRNVSTDRYLDPSIEHPDPNIGQVGAFYLADQNPMDHDNDGVTDEDSDGAGAGRYDEDDDNDGRIDQFTWPCDLDSDGTPDYFDNDDDNDGVDDVEDSHPYDASITTTHAQAGHLFDGAVSWNFNDYRAYSGGVDHVEWERNRVNGAGASASGFQSFGAQGTPSFTAIWDGDLDGDGSPNFLDPDNDDDGTPDSADTDDDNDGILDMVDPDDDNDGILDTCVEIDTNGDNMGDYTRNKNGIVTGFNAGSLVGGTGYVTANGVEATGSGADLLVDIVATAGAVTSVTVNDGGRGFTAGDVVTIAGGNSGATIDVSNIIALQFHIPGGDGDGDGTIDCELDYDDDTDDDRRRPFDQNYNGIYDWLDPDMGGTTSPDNLGNFAVGGADLPYDLDNDNIENENDSFPLDAAGTVAGWNCPTVANPNPVSPDPRCTTRRASFSQFNDWDGDGINNWDDVDDDNDGIIDILDIDWDCDLDNDNDLHTINGALYRDDGPNDVDSDVDGDGLENSIDWDDDNDGVSDLYDPDDGNCGILDFDATDSFSNPYYPVNDGGDLDGSSDGQIYSDNTTDHWNMVFQHNPFSDVMLNYNGYDSTTTPATPGTVPEFYWFFFARWSPYNGGNEWDIDSDGDSLINGLDMDQDGDGMPDWWDQDEGNDGTLDINDLKMGGSFNLSSCGWTAGNLAQGHVCGYSYAVAYKMPLNGVNAQFGSPYSTRPDAAFDQGATAGGPSGNWSCTPGAQGGCYHYDFGADGNIDSALTHTQMTDNRDAFVSWIGLATGLWQWNQDNGPEADFPDELGADLLKNDVDGDVDGDFTNSTIDLDDDYDAIFDWFDVDDDNDGIWDYFEVDSNFDLDDDTGQNNGNFFQGSNCDDNDDDGNDADADDDGFYQAVWDLGIMSQGLRSPSIYDVDNDNDGIPDGEDLDDDNDGRLDADQELLAGCFWGEEQSTWDHDNDGIVNWADNDWDGDGLTNAAELLESITAPFDHDNDGLRDDMDEDDDEDGMHDEDEVLLWPTRFDRNSTNPWDHDDYGDGEGIANPLDAGTGPDVIDNDDDNDTRIDADYDHLEETYTSDTCSTPNPSSDWDHDNNCVLDADDKSPTFITLNLPDNLWLDAQSPAIFSGHVDWLNPITGVVESAPQLPVQVHIEWTGNNTTAIETIDVLTTASGNFSVGQFLYPEDLTVGDNTTYRVYAEVTEMFAFNGNQSQSYYVGAEANMTVDYSAWTYFRSDEQPFWLDFKSHYSADWDRGLYENRIKNSPITFSIFGGLFGNLTSPTNFTGLGNNGYRTDSTGWASLTFVQDLGVSGTWKQVRWNSTADNGVGQVPGAYEQIEWNDLTKEHNVLSDSNGDPLRYDYTNTSLPAGDIEVIARVSPELASEWPFPFLHGDESEPFSIRIMHRMNVEGTMIIDGVSPVYYYDSTINNGDGTFGDWATLFHQPALDAAGIDYNTVSAFKNSPSSWDGTPEGLTGQAANLRPFLLANGSHWFISLVNGGDSNLPPCGPVDRTDPESPIRCEIVPEMNTGESLQVIGSVTNRTNDPWDQDPIALQVDVDKNGQFLGAGETAYTQRPVMKDGEAAFEYNWSWYSQYSAGTYGLRVDFTNSAYYFTGNSTNLAATGAYINVTVVGTTDFLTTSLPRLYRNTNTTIQAKLVDNSLQPVRDAPVNYTWSFDGRTGVNYTDSNGFFEIPFNVSASDDLGNFTLQFEYPGTPLLKGNTASQSVWVVSRTFMEVTEAGENIRRSGDKWDFAAQVSDDNKTSVRDSGGTALSGSETPNGGLVDVIFEGSDFEGTLHRQVVATLSPSAGTISLPEIEPDGSHLCWYDGNGDEIPDRDIDGDGLGAEETIGCMKADINPLSPKLLRADPESFLPDGFGPVNVVLRFQETLPNEGCQELDASYLGIQGAWDPCVQIPGNDHYRIIMTNNANGFNLIGRTVMDVDDQIVYTSEIDPLTGEVVPKPMIVTGQLSDELGVNLTDRSIRVNYEMVNGQSGPVACQSGMTDADGFFAITCPLSDVMAGKAKVTVTYSAYDNNDAYRYENKTVQTEFDVFSNSTLAITEVGPFKSSVDQWVAPNGSRYPVLYLKESFHIDAFLAQSNGQSVGGKCLNIYLDPEQNIRPLAIVRTSDIDGTVEWFSGDPTQNPSLKGVETTGGKLEGFRTLRVAFEPDLNVPGGCDKDNSNALNGSAMELEILVRSRVDLQVKQTWSNSGENGVPEGTPVIGEIALLRDRLDLAVENEEVIFSYEYFDEATGEWIVSDLNNKTRTNEQGIASFEWAFDGRQCDGEQCTGQWRITAFYPGSTYFAPSQDNITHNIDYKRGESLSAGSGLLSPGNLVGFAIILMALLIAGAIYYQRVQERRQVQALRGILTDAMMQLEASNEYIAAIFDCYKSLVKHFKKYGFMKKVYETAREFEAAVRSAFNMVPSDQMDDFLSIFEEARYSEHTIDATHRDRAIQTLNTITNSLTMALGEASLVKRVDIAGLYEKQTKAGEFVAADGSVRQAGIVEGEGSDFKI